MATLSILTGKCGSLREGTDHGFESTSSLYYCKDFSASYLFGISVRAENRSLSMALEGSMISSRNRFDVTAKVRKGKKHDYPWPDDIDPNITTGHLTFLSHFKPLTEKPKPVTLPFEKPLVDLEKKITEVRRMANETGLDFSDQIGALESKYKQALRELYTHLTPIQRLTIARHPNRPTVLDYILAITDKWVELHGDRAGYDDPAIVTGVGSMDGKTYMFIGHQKGRNTKENIARNFAMPTPHGYRKALRMMKYADHHGFPIITFVDTPGAFADLKSEELGQGEAIAHNLRTMFGLKVPVVTVVTGEGGSGGALAIACANKLFMLENSAFYVARSLLAVHITILCGPPNKLSLQSPRPYRLKYRSIGGFQEGIPVDPEKRLNMKPSDNNMPKTADIESELESLKKVIEDGRSNPATIQAIEKLKQDVNMEINRVFISMGLQERLALIKSELSKVTNLHDHPPNRNLKEDIDEIMQEFKKNFSRPGAYLGLKYKLGKLKMVSRLIEIKEKGEKLMAEINQKVHPEIKEKMDLLKNAQEKLVRGDSTSKDLIKEVERAKKDLEEVLRSANLNIVGVTKRKVATSSADIRKKIGDLNEEIGQEIGKVINEAGLGGKLRELKVEIAKGSSAKDVEKLKAEIKEGILAASDVTALKEKVDNLREELSSLTGSVTEGRVGAKNGGW
ncbi:acetyl-coenzyme A carboxylase carboxyl transferase subunit alpha, chloroplastic-like isoform X3 [Carya illinoinensis]|uniref:acetyl-coenzyme A carboxylase carboxyl transferase subunit alpha, chloroplastic-like isoform X3 n=1 Tax=Carya illinoinensis TaxID=32201 RepID=UPI001C71D39B|nr:acetyl-coenzyme A carboxylase carboxyl transferase subunit alpha, chloroplastic-like isoform X3 [Carya illinoinensis]